MKKMNTAYGLEILWTQEFYEKGMGKEKKWCGIPTEHKFILGKSTLPECPLWLLTDTQPTGKMSNVDNGV